MVVAHVLLDEDAAKLHANQFKEENYDILYAIMLIT